MVVEDSECSDPWNWFTQLYSCTLGHAELADSVA